MSPTLAVQERSHTAAFGEHSLLSLMKERCLHARRVRRQVAGIPPLWDEGAERRDHDAGCMYTGSARGGLTLPRVATMY